MRHYDTLVIGAGLSGLTAAALMAKRGLKVGVIDRAAHPGGSCGAFRRAGALHDQGAAMLFGFGEQGFNPHRFVFDALEEPIDIIRHESMYALEFAGTRIEFKRNLDDFTDELTALFPAESGAIKRFYTDLDTLYQHVIADMPVFATPDETKPAQMLPRILAHPRSYLTFLTFMNKSVEDLLGRYFSSPDIISFFDKLCSTYCYTTARETPAVLGAVMFVENHRSGTYYPAGSTLMLPGKLEKAIEEQGGGMLMRREVTRILFHGSRACGVRCSDGEEFSSRFVVHAGTVWDLYQKLLPPGKVNRRERRFVEHLEPTAASAAAYLLVREDAIPADALPVEMFAPHPERLAEDEVTVYLMSLDDQTICPPGTHALTVVGPCLDQTDERDQATHRQLQHRIARRFMAVLERRYPGIGSAVLHCEVATPATIERFAGKYHGAVAGPKQAMGQHLMRRQHTRTRWKGLFCCGESTVMGTGTPAVTVSGIAAANAILEDAGLAPYDARPRASSYVREVPRGYDTDCRFAGMPAKETALMCAASRCCYCLHPRCVAGGDAELRRVRIQRASSSANTPSFTPTTPVPNAPSSRSALQTPTTLQTAPRSYLDIPGIMRRVTVGNFFGARKLAAQGLAAIGGLTPFESAPPDRFCKLAPTGQPVEITHIVKSLLTMDVKRG